MRIASITNWAYGITVGLTLASGSAMLMASSADRVERQAVQQRQVFDTLSDEVENDAWALSDLARLYVIKPSPETLTQYQQLPKGGKTRTAIIPCSNNVFRRLIDIPTRKGTFLLSEELILQFLPKFFKNYSVKEKSLIRVTRNADIDTEMIYDEDLDYRDAMENLIKVKLKMRVYIQGKLLRAPSR